MTVSIVELLAAVPEVARPETHHDARTIAALSAGLDERVVNWALATAHGAVEETYRDLSPSRFDMIARATARSIEAISLNLIRYLQGGRESAAAVRVSKAQHEVTIAAVGLGIPLHRIVGGLRRLGHAWKTAFFGLIVDHVPGEDVVEALSRVDRVLSTYFDALVDDNSHSWNAEYRRLAARRELSQLQLLGRIVDGKHVDEEVVSEVLGINGRAQHIGLIISSDPSDLPSFEFAAFRTRLESSFPLHTITFVPADTHTVWAFVSGAQIAPREVEESLSALAEAHPGAIVSIGLSRAGLAGIRATHLTARSAHAFNRFSPERGPIVAFAEVALLALLTQEPELASWFVEHEVGPLLERTALSDELRKTLRTVIEMNGSTARTAEALYVHRNTITYRLNRIQELLGRDPLARPAETRTALLLAELL